LLRNRIADHEPVHTWDLTGDYTRIRDTTERINPRLAWWIDTRRLIHGPGGMSCRSNW